ncbi:unnamed protein product [Rotaria socialis]|uniref:N(4)-(beta-N-acetylglucosaminyl)-L-asparaginase n=1 Tax=Rotaria socialis TaxID=392032 RepID=A0A818A843_9BILA|nr:unnamed protein product [Rotaria socialis]CAF3450261.1 unnamed protein product [Rotaria socialis]CAF3643300.1 unnamed protein product [Rotaria socialis]CAF4265485.1 unnamed protein product [Rotaria socialis]CAF4525071.1 unnamed protein product [Rotaria socialis]
MSSTTQTAASPIVVNTWPFINATRNAFATLLTPGATCLDAVEVGCRTCEDEQCDGSVGWGSHPDENGETTLDALIMDGSTMSVGAVANLHRIKNAIGVARAVLRYSTHSLLVGESATKFAIDMGFKEEDLHSNASIEAWNKWKSSNCQPNYRRNVQPDPTTSCGPYTPKFEAGKIYTYTDEEIPSHRPLPDGEHDTIGMLAVDPNGNMAAGASTNGLQFKIPGRVADSALIGSGAYVDNEVGGACATGDGDVMQRFVPSYHVVQLMRQGTAPDEACSDAIARIAKFYPNFTGAVLALGKDGRHGAACHGMNSFPYSVMQQGWKDPQIVQIPCLKL